MFTLERGEKLHAAAEMARERGDFIGALTHSDEALVAYQQEGNMIRFAEVVAARFLTLRHLYEETGEMGYIVLAKYTAQASVELAKLTGNESAQALPLFNLAKAKATLGEYQEAVTDFETCLKIMETSPPKEHDREGVRADMRAHLGIARYRVGDREALAQVTEAITVLQASDEPKYNKDVWLSGAHLQLAEVLFPTDKEGSATHLAAAKEIIDANPQLELRAKQWQKLADKLK